MCGSSKCGKVKADKLLFVSQIIYGVGASLGPVMDSPYLTGEPDQNTGVNTTDQFEPMISVEERKAKLEIPFIISGGIQIICKLNNRDGKRFLNGSIQTQYEFRVGSDPEIKTDFHLYPKYVIFHIFIDTVY